MNFITLFAGCANLVLGLVVLLKNPKKVVNITFALFPATMALWAFANFYFALSPSLFLERSFYALGGLVMPLFLLWLYIFIEGRIRLSVGIMLIVSAFLLYGLPHAGSLTIADLVNKNGIYEKELGPLFNVYVVAFFANFSFLYWKLIREFRKAERLKKAQLRYILMGAALFGIVSLFTSIILPMTGFKGYLAYDAQSSLFFVGFASYTLIKHRLLDARFIASKAVQYLVLTTMILLVGFIAGILIQYTSGRMIDLAIIISTAVVTAVFFYVFEYVHKVIEEATNSVFLKNDYQTQMLIEEIGEDITSSMLIHEILFKVYEVLEKSMKTSHILVATTREGKITETYAIGYGKLIKISLEEARNLWGQPVIDEYELEKDDHRLEILKKYDSGLSFC